MEVLAAVILREWQGAAEVTVRELGTAGPRLMTNGVIDGGVAADVVGPRSVTTGWLVVVVVMVVAPSVSIVARGATHWLPERSPDDSCECEIAANDCAGRFCQRCGTSSGSKASATVRQ